MQCEDVREQAAAYGLGALEPPEREAVERHAETCPACRQVLDDATVDASALALATPLRRAPSELRVRLLRQIGEEARGGRRPLSPRRLVPGQNVHVLPLPGGARPVAPPGRRWPWKLTLAASIAALLLLGAAVEIAGLQMQVSRLQARSQALQRGMSELDPMRGALLLLASDGTSRVALQPTDPATSATGAVIWNRSQRRCMVFAAGLPQPPPEETYHVWLVSGDRAWDEGELRTSGRSTAGKAIDLSRYVDRPSYLVVVSLQPHESSDERRPVLQAWVGD